MTAIFKQLKDRIDRELDKFILTIDKAYSLSRLSPLLFKAIRDFIARDGKRVRPILFIVGYRGFAAKAAPGLYTSALAIELLHDFMLVHDDIIDKSDTRRGLPSMHKALDSYLKKYRGVKFNGQDLSIVAGDVMYAMAIRAFLSIQENMERKERALRKFIEAAIYTGSGEFIELLYSVNNIETISRQDIYKIYDYKTAYYTFACPLATGAILAGAAHPDVDTLFKYGIYLGRAFQIKDDILGMFSKESQIGKSSFTDLQEAKKTVLIWYAYNHSERGKKIAIKRILSKRNITPADLSTMRRIISASGALDYARREVKGLLNKSQGLIISSGIRRKYKEFLINYAREVLTL